MMAFPDGGPLAGVVTADATAARPAIKAAAVKRILGNNKINSSEGQGEASELNQ
jgi:hypothetical protein